MLTRPRRGVLMLTLAPEQVHPVVIRTLRDAGVIVCAGHSAADYDTTQTALAAGLSGFTHLYNAMSPLTSREPGMVGAALENAASWCGLINDGHHVHAAALRIALATKPRGKCVLVTDAMPPVGGIQGHFLLQGERIKVHDGVCCNASGVLAGSVLDMASAVRNTVRILGASLQEAARMASTYPAAWLGLERTHGCIAAGYRADLVMMDESLQVQRRWIGGISF